MSEAGLIGIGNMEISWYAMALGRLEQQVGRHGDPLAFARSAAGGASRCS